MIKALTSITPIVRDTGLLIEKALRGFQSTPPSLLQTHRLMDLLDGHYRTTGPTLSELLKHGNFGLGTFENYRGGEMIVLGGKIFSASQPGVARLVEEHGIRTPFAMVTNFHPTYSKLRCHFDSYATFKAWLSRRLTKFPDDHFAVKIHGRFKTLALQCVQETNEAGKPFHEIGQARQTFKQVEATLVGFRVGQVEAGINMAGCHFHALTQSGQGGHVLEFDLEKGATSLHRIEVLTLL